MGSPPSAGRGRRKKLIGWLESQQLPAEVRPAQPDDVALAVRAWNLLGGLDWSGLQTVCELLGVTDPETLIYQLAALRDRDKGA